jgi:hypothetical protein
MAHFIAKMAGCPVVPAYFYGEQKILADETLLFRSLQLKIFFAVEIWRCAVDTQDLKPKVLTKYIPPIYLYIYPYI